MLFTIVTLLCVTVYFLSRFTGGKSWRNVREMFYGNYYAEDGLINQTDKPNSRQAFQNCIDNGIGIKTELVMTKDKRMAVSTYADLSREYGVEKRIENCTMDELDEMGIMSFTALIEMIDGRVPLIVELKGNSDNPTMCRNTADIIKASKHKNIAVCSFNPGVMSFFKEREKDIFRGIVSAPAKEFKNLSKLERWTTGNLANNINCRPNFMLYKKGPMSIFVQFAAASGVLEGVWTVTDPEEAKQLENEKELIVVRGFMPQTVHFKDMPAAPAPQQTPAKNQQVHTAARQRSIAEILADDEEELGSQDGVFDDIDAMAEDLFDQAKEKISEIAEEVKEEIEYLKEEL